MPRGRASWVQAAPLHGFPGWGQVLELPAPDRVEAGPDGVDTRYIVTNLTDRRAQRLYERKYCQRGRMENLLKSFIWPPIGPPAREPAPINLSAWGRLLVAVDVPEPHAEALALAPVRHPPEQADQARHRGHRNGRSHSNCSGPGVPGRGYPHRRLEAPRPVRHLSAERCARTQEPVPTTPNPTPHLAIKTRRHGHWKTYN